jgi:hypothetical protein
VPTQEQSIFIFTHYPTCAQPDLMIRKIYELYQDSFQAEERRRIAEEAYKKPKGQPKPQAQEQEEEVNIQDLLQEEDGGLGGFNQKKKPKKGGQQQAAQPKKPVV